MPPDQGNSKKYSLFSFHRHNNNHKHNQLPSWQKAGIISGCVGLAAACFTAYYTKIQADFGKMQRQNDLEELSQGLITKEEYSRRWPKN